jgi:hypothetical protein
MTLDTREKGTVALGIYFALSGMTADRYGECIKRLKQAGAGHPVGRSYHASFGSPDKLSVFDVWSSQAAFSQYHPSAECTPEEDQASQSCWRPATQRQALSDRLRTRALSHLQSAHQRTTAT